MIGEARARYQDLANRRHFCESGKPIPDTRAEMAELSTPAAPLTYDLEARAASTATNLKLAADSGFVEMG